MKTLLYSVILFSLLLACKDNSVGLNDSDLVSVPDRIFEQALVNFKIDSDGLVNGKVQYSDVKNIDTLKIRGQHILNMKGIEAFTNLKYLDCSAGVLDTLDVSKNTNLQYLNCSGYMGGRPIKSLILGNNGKLKVLDCNDTSITKIDLSKQVNLSELYFSGNDFVQQLDVSNNKQLEVLWTVGSKLQSICLYSLDQVRLAKNWQPTLGNTTAEPSDYPKGYYKVCQ
ncbi:leucine-rich repeat domain-containing protein [Emticicia fontis]